MKQNPWTTLKKIFAVVIVCSWAAVIGILFIKKTSRNTFGGMKPVSLKTQAREIWMGVYLNGARIGRSNWTTFEYEGIVTINHHMRLVLNQFNTTMEVQITEDVDMTRDFQLVQFSYLITSAGVKTQVHGEVEGNKLTVTLQIGSEKPRETQASWTPGTLVPAMVPFYVSSLKLVPGASYNIPIFEPMLQQNIQTSISVKALEDLDIGGKKFPSARIQEKYQNMLADAWVAMDGSGYLKETDPSGMIYVREPQVGEEGEKALPLEPADLIDAYSVIPTGEAIDDPAALRTLTLELSEINPALYDLDNHRQKSMKAADDPEGKSKVQIDTALEKDLAEKSIDLSAINKDEFQEYLQSTRLIESDDNEIQRLARYIIGDESDSLSAAGKLYSWVFENIRKKSVVGLPSALQALESREGDCNEHAALLTALARAAGIPARLSAGLVYLRGAFYYHAWVDLFVGQWVSVDPTLGQFPADVTHLLLAQGDLSRQTRIIAALGKIRIKVIEFK